MAGLSKIIVGALRSSVLLGAGVFDQSSVLVELLKILRDDDLRYWFLELGREISLVMQGHADPWLILMPALRPCQSAILEVDGKFGKGVLFKKELI